MKLHNFAAGSFYYFTRVRFAGRFDRGLGGTAKPEQMGEIR